MLYSKKGLTLMELIAAVAVMAIGIVPIMRFAPTILRTKATAEQMTETVFLAAQKIEEVRGRVLNNFDKAGGYEEGETPFPSPYGEYRYSITDNLDAGIKTISVSAWHIDSPDDKFVLHTKVAKRD